MIGLLLWCLLSKLIWKSYHFIFVTFKLTPFRKWSLSSLMSCDHEWDRNDNDWNKFITQHCTNMCGIMYYKFYILLHNCVPAVHAALRWTMSKTRPLHMITLLVVKLSWASVLKECKHKSSLTTLDDSKGLYEEHTSYVFTGGVCHEYVTRSDWKGLPLFQLWELITFFLSSL